jgi:uncharacterized membrane protein
VRGSAVRRLVAVLIVCLVAAIAAPAWAQSTGGSFGGGSFGGGSSSGGSSSSSSSYSSSSSSSSSSGWSSGSSSGGGSSSYGGGMECEGAGAFFFFLIALGVLVMIVRAAAARANPGLPARDDEISPLVSGGRDMHGSVLQLGIDWHARKELQATLSRLAASGDAGSAEGRARLLSQTVMALRRAELSWLYAGFRDLGWFVPSGAEAAFHRAANDARARFQRELVRSDGGQVVTEAAPKDLAARPEEGAGTVVVTLIVVTRSSVRGVVDLHQAASIRDALEDRGALTAGQLVALEVVWSPAAEQDRMSTSELEQNYPELELIDPNSIAGRIFCEYCSGAFPMELLTCPHCGAAVKARSADAKGPDRPTTT